MTLKRLDPGARMSQAVCIGNIAFLAGQVADDGDADIETQTRQVLDKIDALLSQLGATRADVAAMQIWLSDMDDFATMNRIWDAWVEPGAPPARATGGVALARPELRVEMIATVALP